MGSIVSISIVLAIIAIIISANKNSKIQHLEENIKLLLKRTKDLNLRILDLEGGGKKEDSREVIQPDTSILNTNKDIPKKVSKESNIDKIKSIKKPKEKTVNKFIENWTGSLGVISLVIGFAFLGIFAALKVTQFPRFLLFIIFTAGIFTGSHFLSRQDRWIKISLWLKSASGAIFLFSCIASSSQITALSWIDNPISGLLLVLAGIIFNLYLGYRSKKQLVASVHVLLSLLALSVAPATLPVLFVGTLVTIFGIILTYKEKWDINLLLIITFYALFSTFWNTKLDNNSMITIKNISGILCITSVFFITLFSHYRNVYSVKKFDKIPFLTHFLNWLYLAIGIYLYFDIIPLKIVLLATGSVVALYIAKRAKKLNIRWLYVTDTLIANLLMMIALISFYNRGLNVYFISIILLVESAIFLTIMIIEKETLLSKIAYILMLIFGLLSILSSIYYSFNETNNFSFTVLRSVIFILLIITISFLYYKSIKKENLFSYIDKKLKCLLPIMLCIFSLTTYINHAESLWSPYLFILILVPIIYYRSILKKDNIIIILYIITALFTIMSWFNSENYLNITKAIYLLPSFISTLALIRFSNTALDKKYLNKPGFIFIQINVVVSCYLLFNQLSPYITGTLWLIFSIINNELSDLLLKRKLNKRYLTKLPSFLFMFSSILTTLFFFRHIIVHLNDKSLFGPIKIRYIIEIVTVIYLVYWVIRSKLEIVKSKLYFNKIKSFYLELTFIFIVLTIFLEVKNIWQPVIWISLSLLTLLYNTKKTGIDRVRFYSIVLTWLSLFHLAFITGFIHIPKTTWYNMKWVTGGLTILLNCFYLILLKKHLLLEKVRYPKYLNSIRDLSLKINKKINLWIYYPFFLCVALFIFFTFDKNVITLIFVIESLIIFVLSMFLREENFKLLSMLGLGGCLIRMIFFDLKNSDSITRALVFIGVGIIMVVMNIVYMKFKENYKDEEETK